MLTIFRILKNRHTFPLLLVIIFGILASRTLIFQNGYFNMHDDLQMMRQLQMEKCFLDGQIPCRWVPDMGYGYGFPLFNFYPPLPYIFGEVFRLFGFSFITAVKLTFASAIIFSGIAMYFFAHDFFGRIGGTLASIFYIWAPYHAVDVYVRGAMNESWALVFFPLVLLFSSRLIKSLDGERVKYILFLALSYAGIFLSHNLMVLIFTPFFALWVAVLLFQNKKWKAIPSLTLSGIWALGLASFFTLPALFENKFTQVRTQLGGYFDYTAHFVSIKQLLNSRFWGYDGSEWGVENDGMSFQIGHLHWILSILVFFIIIFWLFRKRNRLASEVKSNKFVLPLGTLFIVSSISAFLTHSRSIFIWKTLPFLSFVQFPWRFLTLVILGLSFVVGALPVMFDLFSKGKLARLITLPYRFTMLLILSMSLIFLNWAYFLPEGGRMGTLTDDQKFAGEAWRLQQQAGLMDYLPIWVDVPPTGSRGQLADIVSEEGKVLSTSEGTYWGLIETSSEEEILLRVNIYYFPGWRAYVDDSEVEIIIPDNEENGRMHVQVPVGEHKVYMQFFNTPIRTVANTISLFSWTAVFVMLFKRKIDTKFL